MKYFLRIGLILFISMVFLAGCNQDDSTTISEADEELINKAETFIHQLEEGNFEEATKLFDETMRQELPPEDLEALWKDIELQLGDFIDQEYNRTEIDGMYEIIYMDAVFNEIDVIFQFTFDEDQQLAGFFVL